MDLDIAGLRVLVTAGASGIGLATARAFVREGARVHVCDVDARRSSGLRRAIRRLTALRVATSPIARRVARFFDEASRALGGLDVLVNNAGIAGPTGASRRSTRRTGTAASRSTSPASSTARGSPCRTCKQSRNASIVNLSSAAGRFGFPLRTPYAAAKWGVIGFTKSLSRSSSASSASA